jgi:hypothetical protein
MMILISLEIKNNLNNFKIKKEQNILDLDLLNIAEFLL